MLERIADVYKREPDKVATNADALMASARRAPNSEGAITVTDALLKDITRRMVGAVDPDHGGITRRAEVSAVELLWLFVARRPSATAMMHGQGRGGEHARRTSARAASTITSVAASRATRSTSSGSCRTSRRCSTTTRCCIDLMTEVWRETHDHLLERASPRRSARLEREMIAEGGAFASSLDADCEGEEGKFYVWSADEILKVLGPDDAAVFGKIYGVTPEGNLGGPHDPQSARLG